MNDKNLEIDEKLKNKIISAAYGDAGLWNKFIVWDLARKNNHVKNLYDSYRIVAKEVHKIKEENFAQDKFKSFREKNAEGSNKQNNFAADLLSIIFSKPLVSAAAVVILIGMIVISLTQNRTVENDYSTLEVEEAEEKVKHAFAIIEKVFNDTKNTLQNDVIGDKIGKPINKSFDIINVLFNKGEKQ